MKRTHYIMPRRSGKTIKAKKLRDQDNKNSFLIEGGGSAKDLIKEVKKLRGYKFKKIIIDEFIPCVMYRDDFNKNTFENELEIIGIDEIVLFSTPIKIYSEVELYLANLIEFPDYMLNYDYFDLKNLKKIIIEIKNSYLTHIDTNIIEEGSFMCERNGSTEKEEFITNICGSFNKTKYINIWKHL